MESRGFSGTEAFQMAAAILRQPNLTPKNIFTAKTLLNIAIQENVGEAAAMMALLLIQGDKIPRDVVAAFKLLEKAAKEGGVHGEYLFALTLNRFHQYKMLKSIYPENLVAFVNETKEDIGASVLLKDPQVLELLEKYNNPEGKQYADELMKKCAHKGYAPAKLAVEKAEEERSRTVSDKTQAFIEKRLREKKRPKAAPKPAEKNEVGVNPKQENKNEAGVNSKQGEKNETGVGSKQEEKKEESVIPKKINSLIFLEEVFAHVYQGKNLPKKPQSIPIPTESLQKSAFFHVLCKGFMFGKGKLFFEKLVELGVFNQWFPPLSDQAKANDTKNLAHMAHRLDVFDRSLAEGARSNNSLDTERVYALLVAKQIEKVHTARIQVGKFKKQEVVAEQSSLEIQNIVKQYGLPLVGKKYDRNFYANFNFRVHFAWEKKQEYLKTHFPKAPVAAVASNEAVSETIISSARHRHLTNILY